MSPSIELPTLAFRAALGTVNPQARTVELIFSTGAPVTRYDPASGVRYIEKLSMRPEHVRLGRLNAGASLLDSHSAYSVSQILGAVVPGTARIEGGRGVATVKFSARAEVEPVWQDVASGIIRHVSCGYQTHKLEEERGRSDAMPIRTAIDWEPFEISMVAMPADPGAKTRAWPSEWNRCVIVPRSRWGHLPTADADRSRRLELARACAAR